MIIRTLAYICDKCKKGIAMIKTQDLLNLPDGWGVEYSAYGFDKDYERHVCPTCIEKKEIKETFK